jgi:multiple sugar transport system ATP-binding protein
VDESHVKALLPSLGKPIILGLRPEDLEHRSATAPADPAETFDAVLEVTEPMGAETHLYLNTGNHTFISRSHGVFRADIGHRMEFVARMSKAHFFELADRAPFKKGSGELDLEKWQVACRLIV